MPDSSGWFRLVQPSWVTGHVSQLDAAYMGAFARVVEPRTMVEVGVASGYSSAILLDALSSVRRPAGAPDIWLHSFDVLDYCYFDPSRKAGEAVTELVPALRPYWQLHQGDVRVARRCLEPGSVALAFIDGYHVHPWPVLDLIGLLPLLSQRAWVLLHDIRLPQLGHAANDGAQYLFEAWPWAKGCEPVQGNVGAVRLDAPIPEVLTFCECLLERSWQADVPRVIVDGIGLRTRGLGEFDHRSPRVKAVLKAAAVQCAEARPVMLWGAGEAGRGILRELRQARVEVAAVLDRDPAKHGIPFEGVDVRAPQVLDAVAQRPFVLLCGIHAPEMAIDLDRRGFVRDDDYLLA